MDGSQGSDLKAPERHDEIGDGVTRRHSLPDGTRSRVAVALGAASDAAKLNVVLSLGFIRQAEGGLAWITT